MRTTKPAKRSESVHVKVTPTELAILKRAAEAADRDWPDWVRRTLRQACVRK